MQNLLILSSSYLFYAWWNWRYLLLIAFGSAVHYLAGAELARNSNPRQRGAILFVSCAISVGLLCIFKYYNFFVESFVSAFNAIGISFQLRMLNAILPVGISFYSFRMLSYTIDAYRQRLEPTKNAIAFFAYISFFPHLAAGPIERASNFLPQFYQKRVFDYEKTVDGMRQMLWGFFKKLVIADSCAPVVNDIFHNYHTLPASTLVIGAGYFAFQIYCDFSGYSDIAIGCSRLFGFASMQNFAYPYFSRDIAEFWRRWHISLTTWFRDYLYIPLGGSRGTTLRTIRNTLIIFLVCGFWHGANWTFVVWGFVNAMYFMPLLIFGASRKHLDNVARGRMLPNILESVQMTITFVITAFAWIFFKADTIGQAVSYIGHIFSKSLISIPQSIDAGEIVPFIVLLVLVEWLQRDKQHGLDLQNVRIPLVVRWPIYYGLIMMILGHYGGQQSFIYFRF